MATSTTQESPVVAVPWQVLELVATNLDPKTLATAACVSKSWYATMTSSHLWKHLCTTHFPSLFHLRYTAVPSLPYHRLYNLGFTSAKRRHRPPSYPKISLHNLLFIITLTNPKSPPVTIIRTGSALTLDHKPLFRFDFDVRDRNKWLKFEVSDDTKVTWNVVLRGFEGVFTMMDCKGKGSFISGSDGWFSAELPSSGCCCAANCGGSSGMVAEMRLVIREEVGDEGRRTVVGSVNVGVLSIVNWRYVSVEDGLRYLQHFLEPCDV
ncbi:putative F-box domain-containing protein [Helianthus annuus]|nr:putative F-box domain-containing protein [Helianthus annuus]